MIFKNFRFFQTANASSSAQQQGSNRDHGDNRFPLEPRIVLRRCDEQPSTQ